MEGTLGTIEVDLEARFATIRTQETNLGKAAVKFNHNEMRTRYRLVSRNNLSFIKPITGSVRKTSLLCISTEIKNR